jgi:hypothetical protein
MADTQTASSQPPTLAINFIRNVYGDLGVKVVVAFLRSLPSDATIHWEEGPWVSAQVFAEEVNDGRT